MRVGSVGEAGPAAVRSRSQALGVAIDALVGGKAPLLHDRGAWPAGRRQVEASIDLATEVGAKTVYLLSGSRQASSWEEAVDLFASFMGPCLEHAAGAAVSLAIEPVNPLFADVSFVHSASTAFALARCLPGITVCLDLFHTWTEVDLQRNITEGVPLISLVQVSDYVLGDRSLPARAVPGDGGIPIGNLVSWLTEAGYVGIVDLELNGPRIDAEGHHRAARRGAQALNDVLEQQHQ
jgi:sugar phosphate isomerase/epimerase